MSSCLGFCALDVSELRIHHWMNGVQPQAISGKAPELAAQQARKNRGGV